jgi:hypothetical protein
MSRVRRSGASEPLGEGERLDRQRRFRKRIIIGGLIIIGFVGGFITGFTEAESLLEGGTGAWPPALSIGLACAYLAGMIGGGLAISRHTDEFELQTQYKAVAAAAAGYMLIYPPWFVLWMGNLVREPMHGVLFLIFWVSLALASLFYRFR